MYCRDIGGITCSGGLQPSQFSAADGAQSYRARSRAAVIVHRHELIHSWGWFPAQNFLRLYEPMNDLSANQSTPHAGFRFGSERNAGAAFRSIRQKHSIRGRSDPRRVTSACQHFVRGIRQVRRRRFSRNSRPLEEFEQIGRNQNSSVPFLITRVHGGLRHTQTGSGIDKSLPYAPHRL